jgi:isocitrate lyase
MGYKFQFVTLAGFHALNSRMFELARGYRDRAWRVRRACSRPSSRRGRRLHGDQAPARGRRGYFDASRRAVTAAASSITALLRLD